MKEITLVGGRGDGRRVEWKRPDSVKLAVPSQTHGWGEVVSYMLPGKKRENNPRLVDRQSWWIAFGQWQIGETSDPICTECADPMPGAGLVGGEVCDECLPYVVGEQL